MVSAVQWLSMTSLILTAPSMASVILLDCIALTLAFSDRYDFDDGGRNVRLETSTLTSSFFVSQSPQSLLWQTGKRDIYREKIMLTLFKGIIHLHHLLDSFQLLIQLWLMEKAAMRVALPLLSLLSGFYQTNVIASVWCQSHVILILRSRLMDTPWWISSIR